MVSKSLTAEPVMFEYLSFVFLIGAVATVALKGVGLGAAAVVREFYQGKAAVMRAERDIPRPRHNDSNTGDK